MRRDQRASKSTSTARNSKQRGGHLEPKRATRKGHAERTQINRDNESYREQLSEKTHARFTYGSDGGRSGAERWGPSWGSLGGCRGYPWPSWKSLGPSWEPLGRSWDHLGPSWDSLRPSWETLGPSWAPLGTLLGRLGGLLGLYWAILEHRVKMMLRTSQLLIQDVPSGMGGSFLVMSTLAKSGKRTW